MTDVVITREGDTVDALLWRHRGGTAVLTEATLELNPGLADAGAILPAGVTVTLPAVTATSKATTRETLKLWD